jgi:hypothetical protein
MRPTRLTARRGVLAAALLAALTGPVAGPARADESHHHGHGAPEALGQVHFPVTCTPTAQQAFDRAMALQHSFWYQAAKQGFSEVLRADPQCVMAYWGMAMSQLGNPFSPRAPDILRDGAAALAKAGDIPAKSDREAGYIAALGVYYRDYDKADHRSRVTAYAAAMGALAARFPDDREAAILYALALDTAAAPTDKTYANQLKAAAILEKAFAEQPQHPGVAHYLIHTYDAPPLAEKGLPAALRYADIAPSAPHALHMPSHIFTRVGYWQQSIDTNRRSAEAAHAAGEVGDEMHAYDYMVYAYLQTAQDGAARQVGDGIAAVIAKGDAANYGGFFAAASIPARLALERGQWADAAQLEAHPAKFANVAAITQFARALGAARAGKLAAARAELEKLRALEAKLIEAKDAYWAEQTGIQVDVVTAWIARAEHKGEAIALMRAAAEREAKTEKAPVTPGPLAPAREMLGEMLLEAGQSADALAAFEASQKIEPNRFRGLYGAARAAEAAGDRAKAKQYYARLVELCERADTDRPELRQAKAFLARG